MVTVSDIGWGSYAEFEGPLFWGRQRHQMRQPGTPVVSDADDILSVITATEGGTYDAYNGYDKCICTSGLIQWCDRAPMFLVTRLLGVLAATDLQLVFPVTAFAASKGYTFCQVSPGVWRFRSSAGALVDSVSAQQQLYLGGASGLKGQWGLEQKAHAKEWAAACSSVWQDGAARVLQREFTAARVYGFALPAAAKVLAQAKQQDTPVAKAFTAAFLSFAANNPKRADDALSSVVAEHGVAFNMVWLVRVLRALTFNSGVAIYPHRYDKIRPVLEQLYQVDLPDFSGELEPWLKKYGFKGVLSPRALQRALLLLGYDLGPKGADGVFGARSKGALLQFEEASGVPAENRDGVPDSYTIPALEAALSAKGKVLDWTT